MGCKYLKSTDDPSSPDFIDPKNSINDNEDEDLLDDKKWEYTNYPTYYNSFASDENQQNFDFIQTLPPIRDLENGMDAVLHAINTLSQAPREEVAETVCRVIRRHFASMSSTVGSTFESFNIILLEVDKKIRNDKYAKEVIEATKETMSIYFGDNVIVFRLVDN